MAHVCTPAATEDNNYGGNPCRREFDYMLGYTDGITNLIIIDIGPGAHYRYLTKYPVSLGPELA